MKVAGEEAPDAACFSLFQLPATAADAIFRGQVPPR